MNRMLMFLVAFFKALGGPIIGLQDSFVHESRSVTLHLPITQSAECRAPVVERNAVSRERAGFQAHYAPASAADSATQGGTSRL